MMFSMMIDLLDEWYFSKLDRDYNESVVAEINISICLPGGGGSRGLKGYVSDLEKCLFPCKLSQLFLQQGRISQHFLSISLSKIETFASKSKISQQGACQFAHFSRPDMYVFPLLLLIFTHLIEGAREDDDLCLEGDFPQSPYIPSLSVWVTKTV